MMQNILSAVRDWANNRFLLDAAKDNKQYVRKNGAWCEVIIPSLSSSSGDISFAPGREDGTETTVEQAIKDLNSAVFQLEASWANSNAGIYEVGTEITPTGTIAATRKGVSVASSAVLTVSGCHVSGMTFTANSRTSGAVSYTPVVTLGGQTKTLASRSWTWTYYRYRGEINEVPTDFVQAITSLHTLELSNIATLSSTSLSANKYYLFAVKGDVNLVCRENSTNAILDGCTKGTCTIDRKNGTGADTYSYILIPKSSSNWTFKITNS